MALVVLHHSPLYKSSHRQWSSPEKSLRCDMNRKGGVCVSVSMIVEVCLRARVGAYHATANELAMPSAAVRVASVTVRGMQVFVCAIQAVGVVQTVAQFGKASAHTTLVIRWQHHQAVVLLHAARQSSANHVVVVSATCVCMGSSCVSHYPH